MNYLKSLSLSVLFVLIASASSYAGISGSAHDMSGVSWNTTGEICIVCHTPHNANTTVADAPLWNHAVTSATYTLYTGTAMKATVGQPAGVSKLCLSCHDGTVAEDSFGSTTGTHTISGTSKLGTDLSNDHPISFTFDGALATADAGLNSPTTTSVGSLGGTIDSKLLVNHKVECSSCHDVHNTNASLPHLLKVDNSGSALCLTCHNK